MYPLFGLEISNAFQYSLNEPNSNRNSDTVVGEVKIKEAKEDWTWHKEFKTHHIFEKLVDFIISTNKKLSNKISLGDESLDKKSPDRKSSENKHSENRVRALLDESILVKHVKQLADAYQICDELEKLLGFYTQTLANPPSPREPSARHWYASDLADPESRKAIMMEMARRKFVFEYACLWLSAIQFLVRWPSTNVAREYTKDLVSFLEELFKGIPSDRNREYYNTHKGKAIPLIGCGQEWGKLPIEVPFPEHTQDRMKEEALKKPRRVDRCDTSTIMEESDPNPGTVHSPVISIRENGTAVSESRPLATQTNNFKPIQRPASW